MASSKMSLGVNDRSLQHSQGKTWHNLDSPFPWSARCALPWSASCALYIENGSGELNSESTCTAIVLAFGKSRFFLKETVSRALRLVSEMLSKYEKVEDNYQCTRDFQRNFWLTAFYVIFFRCTLVHPSSIIPWSVHKDGARDKGSLEKEAGMGNGAWNAIEEESYIWLQLPGQVECCIPKSVGMINSAYFLGCDYRVFDPGGERVLPEQGRRNREATFQSNLRLQENLGVQVVQLSLEEEVAARVLQLRWSSGLYMTTWASSFFHKCLTPQSNSRSNGAIWVFDPGGDIFSCERRCRRSFHPIAMACAESVCLCWLFAGESR
jgi:hypothetical protein